MWFVDMSCEAVCNQCCQKEVRKTPYVEFNYIETTMITCKINVRLPILQKMELNTP